MAEKGLEVIIGMTRDPQFGPMLMFGLGGIFVEVMKDVTFHLAPITEGEAVQMLPGFDAPAEPSVALPPVPPAPPAICVPPPPPRPKFDPPVPATGPQDPGRSQ